MEVIRSTNIVFSSNESGRGSGDGISPLKNNPYKKTRSPAFDVRLTKATKSSKPEIDSISPVKGQPLESPFRQQNFVLPPTNIIDSPLFDDPSPPKARDSGAWTGADVLTSMKKRMTGISPVDSGIGLSPSSMGISPISISPPKLNPKQDLESEQKGVLSEGCRVRVLCMCVNMDIHDKEERAYKHLTLCRIRTMYNGSRRDAEEGTDFSLNPDPVPYQPSNFMSSTMMKKVPVSRRHLDNFGSIDVATGLGKRGVMLHTDRYQWDIARALDGLSQRERLQAEIEYMERLRGIKRRREVLPHRAQLDLLMGGKKIEFTERFEIQREIQKLRSLILPQHAKDLFHGRGFTLPDTHNSLKPRRTLPFDIDLEEDLGSPFSPDKYSFNPETGRVHPKWQKGEGSSTLPKINNKGYLLGHGSPIILSKEKRTVESIKARLRIPTKNFRAQKGEPIPVKTPNPFVLPYEDTWTPYVTRQSTMMSPVQGAGSRSPYLPYSPRKQYRDKADESPDLTLYPASQGILLMSPRYGTGVSQPPYMTRSKTNVVSGHSKQVPGRSLTAMPSKKENAHRPAATAPTVPSVMTAGNKEIKIPVSARDPEEGELNPGTTPAVPKTTPSLDSGKNIIEEEPADLMLEEWPDIQEDKELDRGQPSRLSVARSATSPTKAPTPNPLKGSELVRSLSVEEQTRLKQTFNKLDTDKDGHIKFSQLQTQLPKQFSQSQEKYIKQVYEITSSSTFFGVDEFMTMSYLTNIVTDLRGEALEAYNNIEFHNLHEVILQYVDLFQSIDRGHRGKVSLASLQDILSSALSIDLKADSQKWDHITDTISLTEPGLISKIEFLANIPYFQMTEKKK